MRFSSRAAAALLVVASLGVAACGSDDEGGDTTSAPSSSTEESTPGSAPGSAPGSTAPGEEPQAGGTLTYLNYPNGPTSWDPGLSPSAANNSTGIANYLSAVYGYLLWEDWSTGEVVPGMAESIEATDASTWVLKLREGVEFTDGTPFDAEAVKYNWERVKNLAESPQRGVAATIASLTVKDPLTLEIALAAPNAAFDHTAAANLPFIGSPTALEADAASFIDKPVGAGPFVLESYNAGDGTATLTKNPGYWDAPRPYVDELVIRNILDQAQRYSSFATGAGDATIGLAGAELQDAKNAGFDPKVLLAPGGGTMLLFNTTKPPFDDVNARKALIHAYDCSVVNERVYLDQGAVVTNTFLESSPFYTESADMLPVDRDEAKRLFDEYAAANGPMDITFTFGQSSSNVATADILAATLAEYDNVSISNTPIAAAEYIKSLVQGSFDIAAFTAEFVDPGQPLIDFYSSTGARNWGKYSNPEVDALLAEANSEIDDDARAALLGEAQQLLIDDGMLNFCVRRPNGVVVAERAHGFDTYANLGLWLWDQVWVEG